MCRVDFDVSATEILDITDKCKAALITTRTSCSYVRGPNRAIKYSCERCSCFHLHTLARTLHIRMTPHSVV